MPGREIDGEQPATMLEHAVDLREAGTHDVIGEVVKHEAAEDNIELLIIERHLLDRSAAEVDIEALLRRLLTRSLEHVRRRIDAGDVAGTRDFGSGQRLRPCTAAHVEYPLARPDPGSLYDLAVGLRLSAERADPAHRIVKAGHPAADHAATGLSGL